MTERWWRAYAEARNDPKIQGLPLDMFKAWFNLCCLAAVRDGQIPSALDAALALHMTEAKARAAVAFLAGRNLLDPVPGGYFEPHNWNGRQYKSDVSTDRVKQHRERKRNAQSNGDETFQKRHQIQSTESETEKKETRASALGPDWPPDFADKFWGVFPNKVGRKAALDKLERIGKTRRVSFEELMAGLHGYVRKTDDRPWCNPLTWLNQERWTDQPAAQNGAKNGQPQAVSPLIAAADALVERARQRVAELSGTNLFCDDESPPFAGSISEG